MATVTKRGESYRITASCGYTTNGKQIRPTMTWKPSPGMTERQIKKELDRQMVLFDEKCHCTPAVKSSRIKFETLAKEFFLYVEENNLLKPKSIKNLHNCEERTYAALGHLKVTKITDKHIEAFIKNLAEPGINKRTGGGLSPKTQKHYLNFISDIMNYGIKENIIYVNPCSLVTPPKQKEEDLECYDLEQTQAFFDCLYQNAPLKYQAFFTIDALGGYRKAEILGLEWSDILFDYHIIKINRNSLYTPEIGIYTDTPKTKKSKRTLKQSEIIFDILKLLKQEQDIQKAKLGDRWHDSDRIFIQWDGNPMHPDTPLNYLYKFCDRYGFERTSVHKFRHFNASVLIMNNIDIKTISASLGHTRPSTTLNFYSAFFEEAQAKASECVADAIKIKKA